MTLAAFQHIYAERRIWLHSLHSVGLAWLVIGEFCLLWRQKIPGKVHWPFKRIYVFTYVLGWSTVHILKQSLIIHGLLKTPHNFINTNYILLHNRSYLSHSKSEQCKLHDLKYWSAWIFNSLTRQNSPEGRYEEKRWKMACNWLMMRSSPEVWFVGRNMWQA